MSVGMQLQQMHIWEGFVRSGVMVLNCQCRLTAGGATFCQRQQSMPSHVPLKVWQLLIEAYTVTR